MCIGLCRMLIDWKYGFCTKSNSRFSQDLACPSTWLNMFWKVWVQYWCLWTKLPCLYTNVPKVQALLKCLIISRNTHSINFVTKNCITIIYFNLILSRPNFITNMSSMIVTIRKPVTISCCADDSTQSHPITKNMFFK